ncbi:SRPBCC family protein [Salarchaeum sp. JOR-1]|uniref:SRPBCC family protein n=1 Tax=Salarchaeum sp. JOR-1 TaxID=2599399 RepID=UPI0011986B9B|nr:SRPBCC family protein [Salarchaeum sp. JOR-1]QDX40311.1 SRPBCC family protein [Salarchaeum sp. JOR-1]
MRTVSASRFVQEPLESVKRSLSPSSLIAYEGTFEVVGVEETESGARVAARMPGVSVSFAVSETADGWVYEQVGDAGPFEEMRTEASVTTVSGGVEVTLSSTVALGVPPAFLADRVAGWKRRRELERALDALAADLE